VGGDDPEALHLRASARLQGEEFFLKEILWTEFSLLTESGKGWEKGRLVMVAQVSLITILWIL